MTNESEIFVVSSIQFDSTLQGNACFGYEFDENMQCTYAFANQINNEWTIRKTEGIISLLSKIKQDEQLVIFVHGDGKPFKESLKRSKNIADTYGVKVLLYAWPAKLPNKTGNKNFKNSVNNINKSFEIFFCLIRQIQNWFNEKSHQHKPVIILHSLGNLYLKNFILKAQDKQPKNLFSNIILNAACVDEKDHHLWLDKLNMSERVFVIQNKYDMILRAVKVVLWRKRQLGVALKTKPSLKATYLDLSKVIGLAFKPGKSHSYFVVDAPSELNCINILYNELFNGNDLPTDKIKSEKVDQNKYRLIKPK
ncbi:MAG: hypothetical protein C0594_09145 [Marinilabiliales bacterium]|nr:MAG: hypothetical protein C0594_09145 [Marinilabiliales bacterium]